MDAMYFAEDMTAFVSEIREWMKADAVFFCGYQEGNMIMKTPSAEQSLLANALRKNDMNYHIQDITYDTYKLLQRKRAAAIRHQDSFIAEKNERWFELLIQQTDCSTESFECFRKHMARYILLLRSNN